VDRNLQVPCLRKRDSASRIVKKEKKTQDCNKHGDSTLRRELASIVNFISPIKKDTTMRMSPVKKNESRD
jgi:CO dehydrogenase/acetyl-CoA synthase gamma subunit (corrinoid Fe-S protein)